ncbi:MAG: cytochrome c oxidase assembly protein [Kiloniellales bacterium]
MNALNPNRRIALLLSVVVAGMVGLSFASVPLYRIFCQVTGYGGTTQVAEQAPGGLEGRRITVRFNADIDPQLPWSFQPVNRSVTLPVGEEQLAFYRAENLTDRPLVGTATFNVTPLKAGQYFVKIDCFCFTEQRLEPGQSVEMPVSFFVDPAIVEDPNLDDVHTITLSYTFFPAEEETPNAAADGQVSAVPGAAAGNLN